MREVIIVIHTLAIGGAERRISTTANYMAQKGIKVHMVLIDSAEVMFPVDSRVDVVCTNQSVTECDKTKCRLFKAEKQYSVTLTEKLKLKALHLADKTAAELFETELYLKYRNAVYLREFIGQYPDAVVVSFMTMPNISLMMAMQDLPNRCLFADCTFAELEYPEDSPCNALRKKYYPRANAAIFQTPDEADYYTFLPNTPKTTVPNFIKCDNLPDRYEGERRKDIVDFCRLSPAKDLPLLVDSFEKFHKEFPDYTLSIYGEGGLKDKLTEYIDSKGLSDSVHIYPFDREVHYAVRDAAMFVSSSYREGISNSMLEALAIGLPCVCTDCAGGGARTMIENEVNGLLVPMHDADALCGAMKRIATDEAFSEQLSRNAVKIRERLEISKICDEMIAAIFGS